MSYTQWNVCLNRWTLETCLLLPDGEKLNKLKFDDNVLFADRVDKFRDMLRKLNEIRNLVGLKGIGKEIKLESCNMFLKPILLCV